jgi:hypothetical protein
VVQELRRSPRFPFVAVAELSHPESSRVAELSLNGCYVDMLNTLPIGSVVTIKIFAESDCFEATAKAIYTHPNLGMGLAFQEVSIKSGGTLARMVS